MKKLLLAGAAALVVAAAAPATARAQWGWVGVGPTFPTSDYGDYADTGFILVGGVGFPVGEGPLAVYAEGFFGQNGHSYEGIDGGKTRPLGVMGGVLLDFADDSGKGPYAFGGAGILVHKYVPDEGEGDSESAFGFQGGAGYGFPLGGLSGWVEGRFMSASFDEEFEGVSESSTTAFFGVVAGISIPFSGN